MPGPWGAINGDQEPALDDTERASCGVLLQWYGLPQGAGDASALWVDGSFELWLEVSARAARAQRAGDVAGCPSGRR